HFILMFLILLLWECPFTGEATMNLNYLTNSSGFTRTSPYVGQLVDSAVDTRIKTFSKIFRPDPASRCLNRPCDLSELMTRQAWPYQPSFFAPLPFSPACVEAPHVDL